MTDYWADLTGGGAKVEQTGATDYWSEIAGAPQSPQKQAAEPQKETWGQWIKNSVMGRHDPKEAETGTVYNQFASQLEAPMGTAANFGASDAQLADVTQTALGQNFIRREKDANGYEVFVTRGADGNEQRGYLNKPGLDMQDVTRGIRGSLPYLATGGVAGAATRGAGLGVQAITQGAAAAGTSVAGDVAQIPMGSGQGIEVGKAATMGAMGAIAPVAGAIGGELWRRFVTLPGLVDDATGQLTAKGIEAARRAGIDPQDVTPDFSKSFAKEFSKTGDEAQAATKAGLDRFGIPATKGQVTKDPYLLTQEEGMRRRLYGESAQDTMRGFDERQAEAIRYAALGNDGRGGAGAGTFAPQHGIGEMLNPQRQAGASAFDRTPAALGDGAKAGLVAARAGAKAGEREAWSKASTLEVTPEALADLPAIVNAKLSGRMPNQRATPAAYDMAQELQRIIKGEAPEKAAEFLSANPTRNVDQMRRNLLEVYKGAANDADKSLAGSMYDGFNEWIGKAAEKKLLSGDPEAAMALVNARGFTKDVRDVFRPNTLDGKPSPAAARLKKIENADSGEAVIQALFGSQGSRGVNDGAVQTLQNFNAALRRYAPEQADAAWNDVRLAHWTRLVTGKNGELVGPTAMLNNIKAAQVGQKSVFDTLYAPAEQRQIKEFVRALETISYKPPNASGSGYSAATFAKEGVMRLLSAFGIDKYATAAIEMTGIGKAMGSAAARNAVKASVKPVRPNVAPYSNALAQPYARNAFEQDQSSGSR